MRNVAVLDLQNRGSVAVIVCIGACRSVHGRGTIVIIR